MAESSLSNAAANATGGHIPQRAVRPIVIIIHPPAIHSIPQLVDMKEQLTVEQFIPQRAVEGLDTPILPWTTRSNEQCPDPRGLKPFLDRLGGKLRSIVTADEVQNSPDGKQISQDFHHIISAQPIGPVLMSARAKYGQRNNMNSQVNSRIPYQDFPFDVITARPARDAVSNTKIEALIPRREVTGMANGRKVLTSTDFPCRVILSSRLATRLQSSGFRQEEEGGECDRFITGFTGESANHYSAALLHRRCFVEYERARKIVNAGWYRDGSIDCDTCRRPDYELE